MHADPHVIQVALAVNVGGGFVAAASITLSRVLGRWHGSGIPLVEGHSLHVPDATAEALAAFAVEAVKASRPASSGQVIAEVAD